MINPNPFGEPCPLCGADSISRVRWHYKPIKTPVGMVKVYRCLECGPQLRCTPAGPPESWA
jgi:hypothetical protein